MKNTYQCPALYLLFAASLLLVGCAEKKTAVPKATLSSSVDNVTNLTEQILTAFETDDYEAADAPLHKISFALTDMLKQAKAASLAGEKLDKVKEHINTLLDGFEKELHGFMHGGEGVPEDFDIAPIAEKMRGALAALKSDLEVDNESSQKMSGSDNKSGSYSR